MNRKTVKKLSIVVLILYAFALMGGLAYVGFHSPSVRHAVEREPGSVSYVLVNEDLGAYFNDQHYLLGNYFIYLTNHDVENHWQVASRSVAEAGLRSGTFDAIIFLPQNFSERLLSLQSLNPLQAQITYQIRAGQSELVNFSVNQQVGEILAEFNRRIIQMYFSSILGNLFEAQQNVVQMVSGQKEHHQDLQSSVHAPMGELPDSFDGIIGDTNTLAQQSDRWQQQQEQFATNVQTMLLNSSEHMLSTAEGIQSFQELQHNISLANMENAQAAINMQAETDHAIYGAFFEGLSATAQGELQRFLSISSQGHMVGLLAQFMEQARIFGANQSHQMLALERQILALEEQAEELLVLKQEVAQTFFGDPESDPETKTDEGVREAIRELITPSDVWEVMFPEVFIDSIAQSIGQLAVDDLRAILEVLFLADLIDENEFARYNRQLDMVVRYANEEGIEWNGNNSFRLLEPAQDRPTFEDFVQTVTFTFPSPGSYVITLAPAPGTGTSLTILNMDTMVDSIENSLNNQLSEDYRVVVSALGNSIFVNISAETNTPLRSMTCTPRGVLPQGILLPGSVAFPLTVIPSLHVVFLGEPAEEIVIEEPVAPPIETPVVPEPPPETPQEPISPPNNQEQLQPENQPTPPTTPTQPTPPTIAEPSQNDTPNVLEAEESEADEAEENMWMVEDGAVSVTVPTVIRWNFTEAEQQEAFSKAPFEWRVNHQGQNLVQNSGELRVFQNIYREFNEALREDLSTLLSQVQTLERAAGRIVTFFGEPTLEGQSLEGFLALIDETYSIRSQAHPDSLYLLYENLPIDRQTEFIIDSLEVLFAEQGIILFEMIQAQYEQIRETIGVPEEEGSLRGILANLPLANDMLAEANNLVEWHGEAMRAVDVAANAWQETSVIMLFGAEAGGSVPGGGMSILFDTTTGTRLAENFRSVADNAGNLAANTRNDAAAIGGLEDQFVALTNRTETIRRNASDVLAGLDDSIYVAAQQIADNIEYAYNFSAVMQNARVGGRDNAEVFQFLSQPIDAQGSFDEVVIRSAFPYFMTLIGAILGIAVGFAIRDIDRKRQVKEEDKLLTPTRVWYNTPTVVKTIGISILVALGFSVVTRGLAGDGQVWLWIIFVCLLTLGSILLVTFLMRQFPKLSLYLIGLIFGVYLLLTPMLGINIEPNTAMSRLFILSPLQNVENHYTALIYGDTINWITYVILGALIGCGIMLNLIVTGKREEEQEKAS